MLDSIVAATGNEILRNPMVLFLENLKQEQSMQVQKDKFRSRHHEFEITISAGYPSPRSILVVP